ncbi:MAG: SAM hydrolase/SAM-dependent halogenase family protein [Candidatus Thorarchaeota archaeon]
MIVLMSDFGESEYVGMMKGAIYGICEDVRIVDLTHSITPQSVIEGAWVLFRSYKFFPPRTIFVAVVDPSVGSGRGSVLVKTKNYSFIGPDNGLLYPAAMDDGIEQVFSIKVLDSDAPTFHGRDVFARMAAYLYKGGASRRLGGYIGGLKVPLEFHLNGREGQVVRIDRFGNIVTNLPPLNKSTYLLRLNDVKRDISWHPIYAEGPDDDLFLVTGSAGTLELSMKNTSAAKIVSTQPGDIVRIE